MAAQPTIGMHRALSVLENQRSMLVVNMFKGTKLRFGTVAAAENAKDLLSTGKSIVTSSRKLATGKEPASVATGSIRTAAADFIRTCADVVSIEDVIEAIGSEVVTELIAEITPYVGVVWSAGKLVQAGVAVASDGHNLYKHVERREGFRPGDPLMAADSVKMIIKRDLAKHSVELGRQAVATGTKIAGMAADMGVATTTAIGLANTLAGLGLKLFAIGLDIKDMRAGNKRLNTPATLDATVFEECPILGCYLLTCADTSSVAHFFLTDMGMPGWMDKVEKLKRDQMDPLLKIATKAIDASNLQLDGLQSNKGTFVKKGFFAQVKAKAISKIMGT